MHSLALFAVYSWGPVAWVGLGALSAVGLLALLSPRGFSALAARGSTWIDTNQLLSKLDTRVDVDHYVLPFSRLLGVAVLASVGALAYLFQQLSV